MKKFRIFLSLKKEEERINSIQEEGYRLVSVSSVVPIYTFEKLASKETFIPYVRLDFREKSMGKIKYEDYVTLFSDSGWKLIKGSRSGGAQYFQQEYPDVTRDIFSDTDSQESVKKRWNGNSFFDKFYKVQNFFPYAIPIVLDNEPPRM
ncbi:DUF2812 domain-containing protein [Enterococcus durans]|uniref:DUF2812 domain-containing protein n=1 Tax=Bacteria TaxID=2 RepID=UPI0011586BE6|nr:DUF2812 domain-containing protein [Enterococcus durans]MBE8849504.1 DUF2812 domain-containing protein [Enterococcus durans]